MTFQTEALLGALAIMAASAVFAALLLWLGDRAITYWERRKAVAAPDPYARARALAARQPARLHQHRPRPYPVLGPGR
jgi:hypothetical protein